MTQGTTKGVPIDTDASLSADSDQLVPSQKAVKAYADAISAGSGSVNGPGSSTDNAVVRWDTTTGNLLQDSSVIVDDSGNMTGVSIDANGSGNAITNIDVADLADGTDGELITWDAAGAPATVAAGTSGQVLTSNGAGAAPTFQTPSSVSAATQAEQETATSTTTYVSPGRQQYHPSAVKAWVNFNGTGTVVIDASYNTTSITDNGTGDYSANWSTSFSSAEYTILGCQSGGARFTDIFVLAAGSTRVRTFNSATTQVDADEVYLIACGDQ